MSGWTFTTAKKCLWKANITERGSTCWPSTSHRRLVLCHLVSSISVLPTTSRHLSSGDRSAFRLVLFTADHETEELVQIVTKHVRVYLQGLRVSVENAFGRLQLPWPYGCIDASTSHECRHQSKKWSFAFHELTVWNSLSIICSARQ